MTIELEHHTANVGDVKLHYVRAGKGDPVVLLHGWPQTWYAWREAIEVLAKDYTVIAPDLRGLGASSRPASGYDTNTVANDVHELVKQLGLGPVRLAGHDWGAATAYSYAAQFRDDVTHLAIFEMVLPGFGLMEGAMTPQPGGNFLWHMAWQSVPDIPFTLINGREDEYLRWFFEFYAYDPSAVSREEADVYVRAMTHVGALRAGLGYYQDFFTSAAQNEEHAKKKLTIPVIAWGGEACLAGFTLQCLELAAENVTGGVIERSGHWVAEERGDFMIEQITTFFKS
jgi:pimeloyl-ACP methyl ester carboxylesterase